ncbi:MAG TPA: MFS transporter [Actinomycetota bacterium]|nr:MFS transporter [Actinomycetota bacterium]
MGAAGTTKKRWWSRGAKSLWRHSDFLRLWSAETISQLGTQVTLLALPLIAILLLRANPFEVGLLTAVEYLPFLLVGLPAGVWVDRLRRRPILIAADIGRAVSLASIPVAHAVGELTLGHLYLVAFFNGTLTVFFDVAYMSYLPSLVERGQLVEGNSKLEVSRSGAELAGPGLAGAMVQVLTAPVAIVIDAISFVGSALFLFLIRHREPSRRAEQTEAPPRMRTEIAEGLRYVLRHRLLLPIAICTSASNLFAHMAFAIYLVFAVRQLGLSAALIGVTFALGNVGFVIGAVTASRIAKRLGVGRTIWVSAAIFGPSLVLIPLAPRTAPFPFLVAAWFLGSFGSVVYNVNQVSLRQAITPDRMQGRMNATIRFLVWGTMPIGAFIGGALANAIGLRTTLFVAAVGGLFVVLPVLLSPVRKLREIPEPEDEPTEAGPSITIPPPPATVTLPEPITTERS